MTQFFVCFNAQQTNFLPLPPPADNLDQPGRCQPWPLQGMQQSHARDYSRGTRLKGPPDALKCSPGKCKR